MISTLLGFGTKVKLAEFDKTPLSTTCNIAHTTLQFWVVIKWKDAVY